MTIKSLYEVLGVQPDAGVDDIRRAYKRLALKCHPDKNPGDETAAHAFQRLSRAYEILSDEQRRRHYDETGEEEVPVAQPAPAAAVPDFKELFKHIFQDAQPMMRAMRPDVVEVPLGPKELLMGGQKRIEVELLRLCPGCGGCGGQDPAHDVVTCIGCEGTGTTLQCPIPSLVVQAACPSCGGQGRIVKPGRQCKKCGGEKTAYVRVEYNLNLGPGVPDGLAHTLHQEGGYNAVTNKQNDLVMVFRRVQTDALRYTEGSCNAGMDVHVRLPVGLDELLCGFQRQVNVYEDEASAFNLTSTGYFNPSTTELRLPGRGLPRHGAQGAVPSGQQRGLLIIKFDVVYPDADAQPKLGRFAEAFARVWKRQGIRSGEQSACICVQDQSSSKEAQDH